MRAVSAAAAPRVCRAARSTPRASGPSSAAPRAAFGASWSRPATRRSSSVVASPIAPRRRSRRLVPRASPSSGGDEAAPAPTTSSAPPPPTTAADTDEEYDVIVVGSGIGGLSAASLLAKYGYRVKVFESHYLAGGCCHMFDHRDKDGGLWQFEVGPSIWEGLDRPTGNPLRMVFDALGEEMPVETYDGISMWTEEGHWRFQVGDDDAPGGFCDLLREKSTDPERAVREWKALKNRLEPLYDALDACPLTALRQDAGLLVSTIIAIPFYLTHPRVMLDIPYILDSFHKLSRQYVTEPFLKQWIDMLAFFSGFPAEGTMGATMIYSIPGFHRPGASLCAPVGGTQAVVDKLVGALEKFGGSLELKKHVDEIIVENGECTGVRLRNGRVARATHAVVSNATVWDTMPLLPDRERLEAQGLPRAADWKEDMAEIPALGSIMHLFLGIDAEGLPDLDPSHLAVLDWSRPLGDPQNVVTIFIPTVLDPGVAPEGKHIVHVYTAGSEPFDLWEGKDRGSAEYKAYKRERAQILWDTIERIIPDVKQRVEVEIYASPLTHQRFLRRHRGTYGPALEAGGRLFGALPLPEVPQPGVLSPIPKLVRCGDSVFPGVGVPAVAASGAIAAATLAPLPKHLGLMWDVAAKQGKFWKEHPGWMDEYLNGGENAPFHPRGKQHPVGGAEHMKPEEYYVAKDGKKKISAFVGKGGVSAVAEERVREEDPKPAR
jgi:phytoene dehydrogenase-like protein